ncbi:Zinc finger protein [Plakobranchus ocellatus]|uniref:Zinc finger protein n=1 Tax=Plakobranchus ocellatus TaxID=259542 RepID=A0AAV4AU69_9GAST|nr:Zinc finger protein [Plakobranchus ocellatus]
MKEERDREEKREAQERQEKKEAQERQEKKEEQERKDKLELEKLKLQAEIENAKSLHSKKDSSTSDWIAKIPRMNPFSEAKGDTMDAFLFRFEMLVKAHNWPEDKKFLALSNLLTGESLKVLQTLSVEQETYACLKQALLKKFLCTAADYNVKFRTAVPTNTEDAHAFISRLETVFDKWLELSNIKKGNLAYKYRTAHPAKLIAKEVEIVASVGVAKESKNNQEQFNRTSRRDKWQQKNNQRSSSCGPNWKQRDYAQPNKRFPRWNDSPHNNFRRQNKGNFRGYSQRRPSRGRGMLSRGNYHGQRYECASSASILFNKFNKSSPRQLNIVSGKINGTDCTVLRDTGCTFVGIRQSLLKPNDVTNETATCQMFDGSEKKFRKATAFIETPYFTGKVTALALANPAVEVIVGNIIGVGDQPNLNEQSPTWKNDPDSAHKAHAYVSTRAQKSTADNVNPNNSGDNKQAEKMKTKLQELI